ncbi:MAG: PorT family protein [Ferruginibacter sp.]|nr:PorT family protein [Cytophagales bacterium]
MNSCLIATLLTLITAGAMAQSGKSGSNSSTDSRYFRPRAITQPVRFGIKAGLNVADWQGDASESASGLLDLSNGYAGKKVRPGFHAGAYAVVPLGSQFTLEPGVYYSQKGTVLRGRFTSESFQLLNAQATVTNQASYLDVPVLAKYYAGGSSAEGFHFFAGPQVSFLLSNRVDTRASLLGFSVLNQNFDVTDNFRRVDVALVGGLGYRFSNGLNLGVGYDFGLNTLDQRGNFDTYNRVVKASVGFDF